MRRRTKRSRRRHAFTLMELLLVMAILVILLSLVATRFTGTQKKSNINAAKAQIGLLKQPLDMFALDMNTFPTTEQGLEALTEAPADLEDETKWQGPYTDAKIGTDPWGNEYQYRYPPENNKEQDFPEIWSLGPDGEDNTEDDISNWDRDDENT